MGLSIVGHGILFFTLVVFVGLKLEKSVVSQPLVIKISPQETPGSFTAEPEADSTLTRTTPEQIEKHSPLEPPARTVITMPEPVRDEPAPVVITEPTVPVVAAAAVPEQPADNSTRHPAEQPESPVQSMRVLATTQSSNNAVAPVAPVKAPTTSKKVSMSAKQEKMLQRRLKKLANRLHQNPALEQDLSWEHKGQQYTAKIKRHRAKDDMDIEKVIVAVSTTENGNTVSTELSMKRLAFSNFTQFVDRWDPEVRLHNDELDGRFHSNSGIKVLSTNDATPMFLGKVTTAKQISIDDDDERVRRADVFQGGLETGVKRIGLLNKFAPLQPERRSGSDNVHYFAEDATLRFYPDGTYGWKTAGTGQPEQIRAIGDDTAYLIAQSKTKLFVSGVIKGKVLVYSPERIIIEDDLVYAHDPQSEPEAGNYLGLVSNKFIDVAGPDVTGPGDLAIHASIYAKIRFAVKKFRAREDALLHIYGSLTAGTITATEPRFRTKIEFDKRLESRRPPGFPVTNRYELEPWDATWQSH